MTTSEPHAWIEPAGWVLLIALASTLADAQPPVVPSDWRCRYCPLPAASDADWWLGSAYVSDASGKFGDFTGLDQDGFYAVVDGAWRQVLDDGRFWSLQVDDLGLESRSVALDGGRPGAYRAQFRYDALPKFRYDEIRTPYAPSARMTLPASWVTAGSTAGFTALPATERKLAIGHDRERFKTHLEWNSPQQLDYRADFRRDTRSGSQLIAGSFAAVSAWLPVPLDYVTDEIELAVGRTRAEGTFEVGYRGSRFSNDVPAIDWQNPFTPFVAGADFGQLATAPSNRMRQLYATGSLRVGRAQLAAQFSSSQIEQDEPFLAATINPTLGAVALPRSSLDGKVATQRLTVDLASRLSSRLRITARLEHHDRDNQTAAADFTSVLTDLAVVGVRTNTPYDFAHDRVRAEADIRLPQRAGLKIGAESDRWDRQLQARERTDENAAWIELDVRRWESARITAGVTERRRRGSDYTVLDRGGALQNPRLRQYHLADRDQRVAKLDLAYSPTALVTTTLRLQSSDDRYPHSELGLTAGDTRNVAFDIGVDFGAGFNGYASLAHDDVELDQAGSQQFGMADWRASTRETTRARSVGIARTLLGERLEVRFDVNASDSHAQTAVSVGSPETLFPDFSTQIDGWNLSGTYAVNERLRVRASYRSERYSDADWQIDGVDPATIPSILTVGARIPRYSVDMVSVAFSYTPARR